MKEKNWYIDNVKAVLIILVIGGHLLHIFSNSIYGKDLYDIIYSFHMPLFLFISGLLSKSVIKKDTFTVIKTNFISLIIPYFIFFYAYEFILYILFNNNFSFNFLFPSYALWFLLTLFTYRVFLKFFVKFGMKLNIFLGIMLYIFATLILSPLSNINLLALNRTLGFYLFFILGYYTDINYFINKIYYFKENNIKYLIISLGFIICILISILNSTYSLDSIFGMKATFRGLDMSLLSYIFLSIFCLFSTFSLSLLFLILIPKNKVKLTYIGSITLYIYLLHILPIKVLQHIGGVYSLKIDNIFLIILTSSFFILLILLYCFILMYIGKFIKKKFTKLINI